MRPEPQDPATQDAEPEHGDARDAVTGPVGSASLVELSTLLAPDDELEGLTPIDEPKITIPANHA